MKSEPIIIIIFLLFFSSISYAQKGKDDAKTISASNTIVNEYTSVTANVTSGATSITVKNSNLNTNNRFAGPLAAGDLIMIIQMQGATINGTATDSAWGAITNYNNCGLYEFLEVTSVPNATTININCSIKNNYTSAGKVQIVRMPRFTTLTINNGGTLTADTWNGTQGGIISVEVQGNTIINGTIDASGKGFRGGALTNTGYNYDITIFFSTSAADGGQKGESIAGYQTDYNTYGGMFGRGAPANGGGGGNSVNAAGGGGANAGNIITWTGNGNPDVTTSASYSQAWNLEYAGFANSTSSGGGKGGYTWGGDGGDPLTEGSGNSIWGYDYRYNHGGKGGRPLDYSNGRIFMGGGGGSGHENDNNGGAGGNGGGIIYLLSYGQVSGSGNITSTGQKGGDNNSSAGPGDGAGGGGSGGTIIINSTGTISVNSINADGGNGGNQIIYSEESEGPGGGGSGGYIGVSSGNPNREAKGGANGTSNSSTITGFPPDGGTFGGVGLPNEAINPIIFSSISLNISSNIIICSGQSTRLLVTGGGSNNTYSWTPSSGLNNTTIANPVATPVNTTKYIVTVSNGTTCSSKDSTTVTVMPKVAIINSTSDSICLKSLLNLNAGSSSYTYSWNPTVGLSCSNCNNPIASPSVGTTYTVIATNQYCNDTGIYIVKVLNAPVLSINNTTMCSGQSTKLNLIGGNANDTYSWTPSAGIDSTNIADPLANPTSTTKYVVTVSNGTCTAKDSILVTILTGATITRLVSDSICPTTSLTLNAGGSSAYTYSWSPSTGLSCTNCSNPIAAPATNTTYTVIVGNQCGSDTGRQMITILPLPTLTINDTTVCYGQTTQLNIMTNGTLSWSPYTYLSCTKCNTPKITPFSDITYTITATLKGCSLTDVFNVNIDQPVVYAGNDTTIYTGSKATLRGSGVSTFSWFPSGNLSDPSNPNTMASPSVTTTYTLIGFDSFGCSSISSVIVFVKDPCEFPMLPNAFSPNNDGNNDVYKIINPFVDKLVSFRIYNRWGQLVFQTTDLNIGWNGKFNGQLEQVGAYVYYLDVICHGTDATYKGNVTLLR